MINLEAFGFPADPSDHRAVQRVRRPRRCLAAGHRSARAQRLRAPRRSTRRPRRAASSRRAIWSCSSPSTCISRRSPPSSRIDAARAQQETARGALPRRRRPEDRRASSPASTCCARRCRCRTSGSGRSSPRTSSRRPSCSSARAIGLPPGQAFTLTDKMPYRAARRPSRWRTRWTAPTNQRADYLAARERVAAAEATRRAAAASCCRRCTSTPTTAPSARRASESHADLQRSAATVRVPIFEGGRAPGAARSRADAELPQRDGRSSTTSSGSIDYEVRAALPRRARRGAAARGRADHASTLADQELEQARDRFAAGVASNIEVTQAQESVAAASEHLHRRALRAQPRQGLARARASGIAETAIMQYLGGVQ